MRISDWSSDVCSSDLAERRARGIAALAKVGDAADILRLRPGYIDQRADLADRGVGLGGCQCPELRIARIGDRRVILARRQNEGREIGRASCRERVCQYV